MQRVDVTYVLVFNESEQRILMVLNSDNNKWTLPGGAVESGETLVQAAVRETLEETGVTVQVGDLVSVNECFLKDADEHALFFTFRARISDGEPHVVRPDEISAVEWVDMSTANEYLTYHPSGIQSLLQASCPYIFEGVQ